MSRRFSPDHLYALRNEIPIHVLIEKYLSIPCNRTKKRFRFACPSCTGFNTSVLWKKNLGRCFDCNKNFNTIDMSMRCLNADFVESVNRLDEIRDEIIMKKQCVQSEEGNESFKSDDEKIADTLPDRPDIGADTEQPVNGNQDLSARMDEVETKLEFLSIQIEKIYDTLTS